MTDTRRLLIHSIAAAALLAAALQPRCALAIAHEEPLEAVGISYDVGASGFPRTCIAFNDDLSWLTPLDVGNLVAVEGPSSDPTDVPIIKLRGNEVCMEYLKFGGDYKATFRQGLTGSSGRTLKEDLSCNFTALSMRPRVAAYPVRASREDGTISISISAINLKAVRVSVAEVPKEQLRNIAIQSDSGPAVGTQKAAMILARGYKLLSERVIRLPMAHDTRTSSSLTVQSSLRPDHSYLVLLSDPLTSASDAIDRSIAGSRSFLWGASLFINSPLTVVASRVGDTLYASAAYDTDAPRGMAAKPASGAELILRDAKGVQLDASVLDSDGRTSIGHLSRFASKLAGAKVIVNARYGKMAVDLPKGDGPNDEYSNDARLRIEASINRTSCNPGDVVSYMALARAADGSHPPAGDLMLDVISPSGMAFKSIKLASFGYGAYASSFRIPAVDHGGAWTLRLRNSGGDVADERTIEVSGTRQDGFTAQYGGLSRSFTPGTTDSISFRTMFPGGYPAYGILGSATVSYTADRHPFSDYKEYAVGPDPHEKLFESTYQMGSAATGDDGVASFLLKVPEYSYPKKATVQAIFRSQDGDPVRAAKDLHISPSENICGVRIISAEGRSLAMAKLFTPQGKPVSGRIYYKISRLEPMPAYIHRPDGWSYEFEHSTVKLSSGQTDFNASRDASGEIQLPTADGLYMLELATASGMRTSATFVNGFTAAAPGKQILKVKAMNTGGTSWTAQFDSPYGGRGELAAQSPYGREVKTFEVLRGRNTVPFSAPFRQDAPMRVEVSAFFKENKDLSYTGHGATTAHPAGIVRNLVPIIDEGERRHTANGDTLVLRLRPSLPGIECSFMIQAVSTPYASGESPQLDLLSRRTLDRSRSRPAYSGVVRSTRGSEETVEIPIGSEDQVLDVKVLCWNELYSGQAQKSFNITFPARIAIDPLEFLNAGDVAAPQITVVNNRSAADFTIRARCTGAAECADTRRVHIIGGDSEAFLLPVTARRTGRATMSVLVESGGFT
ncbi:MAG: hypothetical protein ACI4NA_02100, partial [Succinivibrio sp.]